MRKYVRRIAAVLVFAVSLTSLLWWLGMVLKIKRTDGVTTMQNMYAQDPNTVDVLVIGSSHAGMNLDMEAFWRDYGIPAYSMWGSLQPMWNTYYNLKEALKTQHPRVVVLDVYAATFEEEYSDNPRQETNLVGMNFNKNKVDAIHASAPKDRWNDLIFEFPLYHSRISDLSWNDFLHFPWNEDLKNDKGTSWRYGVGHYEPYDVSYVTDAIELYPKEETYLRKIIELCRDSGIPLLLVKTPTVGRESQQPYYNRVQQIADEYGVHFYNLNLADAGTKLVAADFWEDGHLNTNGCRKISSFLAGYLRRAYHLPDRRGSESYASWDVFAQNIRLDYLTYITDPLDYANELKRYDYAAVVVKNATWDTSENFEYLLESLENAGISAKELRESGGGNWILTGGKDGQFIYQPLDEMVSQYEFNDARFKVGFKDDIGIQIDGEKVASLGGQGITIAVYDKGLKECVDVVNFALADDFQLTRPE